MVRFYNQNWEEKLSAIAWQVKNIIELDDVTTPVNALSYFNPLVIFAQRESNLELSLRHHEMTPIPMTFFSTKKISWFMKG